MTRPLWVSAEAWLGSRAIAQRFKAKIQIGLELSSSLDSKTDLQESAALGLLELVAPSMASEQSRAKKESIDLNRIT